MAFRAATLDRPKLRADVSPRAIATPPRRIRTGPLPTLPRGDLAPIHGIEGRLPLLLLGGLAVLAAIQLALAL
jgi:hypothetical protein